MIYAKGVAKDAPLIDVEIPRRIAKIVSDADYSVLQQLAMYDCDEKPLLSVQTGSKNPVIVEKLKENEHIVGFYGCRGNGCFQSLGWIVWNYNLNSNQP